jgi:MarC family membrane protein
MSEHTFFSATILLLLVTDPLGNIPIFISALDPVPRERRTRVVLRELAIAFAVLLGFMAFGRPLMDVMQLSNRSLGIAGGVVLFLIALRMIFPRPEGVFGEKLAGEPFIVPLAIPSLAGPSALATVLLLVAQNPSRLGLWVVALAVVMLINAAVLLFAERIAAACGERVVQAFERLMGLILIAVSIEMLLTGIASFLQIVPGETTAVATSIWEPIDEPVAGMDTR